MAIDLIANGTDVCQQQVDSKCGKALPCNQINSTDTIANDLNVRPVTDGDNKEQAAHLFSQSISSSMEKTASDPSTAAEATAESSVPQEATVESSASDPESTSLPTTGAAASASSPSGKATTKMTAGGSRKGHSVQSGTARKSQSHHHQQQAGSGSGNNRSGTAFEMPLRLVVSSDMVGAIIGKAGATIREITRESKARVDVLRKDASGAQDKVINIFGSTECCNRACSKILEVMFEEARNTDKNPDEYPLRLLAHNALIGRVIGKSGATIKRIMESTATRITISPTLFDPSCYSLPERVVVIEGKDLISIIDAEGQILSKLRTSYESDMAMAIAPSFLSYHSGSRMPVSHVMSPAASGSASRQSGSSGQPFSPSSLYAAPFLPSPAAAPFPFQVPPFGPAAAVQSMMQPVDPLAKETAVIYIPNSCVGAMIGTGGATIREMMHTSGANIKVAQVSKDQKDVREEGEADVAAGVPPPRERRVTVIGAPEAQWKAQMYIFRKILMDPSISSASSSSEPAVRVEIMVPSTQVGRIIGKNGQTVRELQRLTRALIKLPEPAEQGSAPPAPDAETPVSIVGDFFSSQVSGCLFRPTIFILSLSFNQNAQRQIRALVSRGQMSGMVMGAPAFEVSGFQRQRDDHRSRGTDNRASKSKASTNKSTAGRAAEKQPATHEAECDSNVPSDGYGDGDGKEDDEQSGNTAPE